MGYLDRLADVRATGVTVYSGEDDPNTGPLVAANGSLYIHETTPPAVYQYDSSVPEWVLLGSGGSGGGGGVLALSYLGTNAIGGSTVAMTARRVYMKKITPTADGVILGISAYLTNNGADNVQAPSVAIFSDNAGAPLRLLASSVHPDNSVLLESAAATPVARWLDIPINLKVTAATSYWIAVMNYSAGMGSIAYTAATGSDSYYTSGGGWFTDAGFTAISTTTDDFSIRALYAEEGAGGGGATAIDDLTDVDTSTTPPTDGQVLVWDAASSQWLPGTSAGGGGLADLTGFSWAAWYDQAQDAFANNDPVTSWTDRSGNARHAIEATNPPTFKTAVALLNGHNGLLFDGTNDFLSMPLNCLSGLTTAEVFAVVYTVGNMAANGFWKIGAAVNAHHRWNDGNIYEDALSSSRSTINAAVSVQRLHIWRVRWEGGSQTCFYDGKYVGGVINSTLTVPATPWIGQSAGGQFYNGYFCEFAIGSARTGWDGKLINDFLLEKYS